jgi:hypothetical protein
MSLSFSFRQAACCAGLPVSSDDAVWVVARLRTIAETSMRCRYDSAMTTDPRMMSRAVFEWWWEGRGQRGVFARKVALPAAAGPADTAAIQVVSEELGSHWRSELIESLPGGQLAPFHPDLVRRKGCVVWMVLWGLMLVRFSKA